MNYGPLVDAFWVGTLAALSLPLGALIAEVWRPSGKTLAFFMAFGGGALIAALAIELLVPAVHDGYIMMFSAGSILGCLLFKGLDTLLNRQGGYLRKTATAAQFWKGKAEDRLRAIVSRLRRVDLTADLPNEIADQLLSVVAVREFPGGMFIYRQHDPAGNLYVIEKGRVDLLDPAADFRAFEHLQEYDAFGRMSFLTGLPRATEAIARSKVRVLMIPREPFMQLVETSTAMRARVAERIAHPEIRRYLEQRYGLSATEVDHWLHRAVNDLIEFGRYEAPLSLKPAVADAEKVLTKAHRTEIFRHLPQQARRQLAERLVLSRVACGFTFFRTGQLADRMYVLTAGRVALIDPSDPSGHSLAVIPGDAFGADSFVTEGAHTVTAVALEDSEVYALRRKDVDALLDDEPDLRRALADYLRNEHVYLYLTGRQKIAAEKAARWVDRAVRGIGGEALCYPTLAELKQAAAGHGNVAIAIFLGLLLDGIPESLVIGASLTHEAVPGLAMIGSVFVSNFPEALSSAAGMRAQGFGRLLVMTMWTGVLLVAGLSATLGALALGDASPEVFSVVEGVAAGAMLTVVAETLLPEAFHKGGGIVGISTLLGLLTASMLGAVSLP